LQQGSLYRTFLSTVKTLSALSLAFALVQGTDAQRARVAWVPNPRVANGTWVADPSRRLSAGAVATINGEISALEAATGAEIAVVVVDSTSGLDPFDFALAIHRAWGVGKRGANNGVVLLWVPAQRAAWISVGQGLEGAIPDRRAGRIRDEEIFPAFRRGEFDAGIIAGVRALAAAARSEGRTASTSGASERRGRVAGIITAVALGFVALFGGIAGLRRWQRRRPRPCPNGHGMMRRLDEAADDEKLEGGERLEESYRSVDWDVWLCDTCGHTEKIPYRRWTSSYSDCPECKRRTLKTSERTITRATTLSTGRKIVTRTCGNCGFKDSREVVIPRVSTASSSSAGGGGGSGGGGGGGSFGGGSAGGGGAGGRY
jgi:uncharacterized protein